MKYSTKNAAKSVRDVAYYRKRYQNRVFANLVAFVTAEAQRDELTKKDIAERMGKDPGSLSRLLSQPSNLTLDTITDFALAFDAEAEPPEFVKFSDRTQPNYVHPLIARAVHSEAFEKKPRKAVPTPFSGDTKAPVINGSPPMAASSLGAQLESIAAE